MYQRVIFNVFLFENFSKNLKPRIACDKHKSLVSCLRLQETLGMCLSDISNVYCGHDHLWYAREIIHHQFLDNVSWGELGLVEIWAQVKWPGSPTLIFQPGSSIFTGRSNQCVRPVIHSEMFFVFVFALKNSENRWGYHNPYHFVLVCSPHHGQGPFDNWLDHNVLMLGLCDWEGGCRVDHIGWTLNRLI